MLKRRTLLVSATAASTGLALPLSPAVANWRNFDPEIDLTKFPEPVSLKGTQDIPAMDVDHKIVGLSSLCGKQSFIINFMNPRCSPCVAEMESLNKLAQKLSDMNVKVLPVIVHFPKEDFDDKTSTDLLNKTQDFLREYSYSAIGSPVVLTTLQGQRDFEDRFGGNSSAPAIPHSVVVRAGTALAAAIGARLWDNPKSVSLIKGLFSAPTSGIAAKI